jgi:hypothetical protein
VVIDVRGPKGLTPSEGNDEGYQDRAFRLETRAGESMVMASLRRNSLKAKGNRLSATTFGGEGQDVLVFSHGYGTRNQTI